MQVYWKCTESVYSDTGTVVYWLNSQLQLHLQNALTFLLTRFWPKIEHGLANNTTSTLTAPTRLSSFLFLTSPFSFLSLSRTISQGITLNSSAPFFLQATSWSHSNFQPNSLLSPVDWHNYSSRANGPRVQGPSSQSSKWPKFHQRSQDFTSTGWPILARIYQPPRFTSRN